MNGADPPPVVLYIASRFPKVTETFVVNEWLALSGRFQMELAALRRTREAPVHPESRHAMARVRFLDAARAQTAVAHLAWLARRPGVYLSLLAGVLRDSLRHSPLEAAKGAVLEHPAEGPERFAHVASIAISTAIWKIVVGWHVLSSTAALPSERGFS